MKLYNTLNRKKEEFQPMGEIVKMYVCGVTTNDKPHIGHAMSYIIFDVLHRYLKFMGLSVKRVQNFTDIDDKIIDRANMDSTDATTVSERNISAYFNVMDKLNIMRADVYPRATTEIVEIIEMITNLISKGNAYESGGSVYFSVSTDQNYGRLSNRNVDEMLGSTRFEKDENKDNFADFVLWKAAKPNEPFWDSPWGKGRPGWHIECSAMVFHHLGYQIDIHGGGQDLVFPHHENEISQSESASGTEPFSKFWIHNGLVEMSGTKMSKSIGNVLNIEKALENYSSDAIRLWVLQSHYRSPLLLDEELIAAAETSLGRIRQAVNISSNSRDGEEGTSIFFDRFKKAMDDDLGTPSAIACVFDVCREIFRRRDSGKKVESLVIMLREFLEVLGFTLEVPKHSSDLSEEDIEKLINRRHAARLEKRFEDADKLREELTSAGVRISDEGGITKWIRF